MHLLRRTLALAVGLVAAGSVFGAAPASKADVVACAGVEVNLNGSPIYLTRNDCLLLPLASIPPPVIAALLGGIAPTARPAESGATLCYGVAVDLPGVPVPVAEEDCVNVPLPSLPDGTIPPLPPVPPIGLPPIPPPIPPNIPGLPPIPLPGIPYIPGLPALPI